MKKTWESHTSRGMNPWENPLKEYMYIDVLCFAFLHSLFFIRHARFPARHVYRRAILDKPEFGQSKNTSHEGPSCDCSKFQGPSTAWIRCKPRRGWTQVWKVLAGVWVKKRFDPLQTLRIRREKQKTRIFGVGEGKIWGWETQFFRDLRLEDWNWFPSLIS